MKKVSNDKLSLALYLDRWADQVEIRREYMFCPGRRWRFDWAIPSHRVAIEYEGGVFVGGGHTRGVIYGSNCEKYNQAALMGWTVLRFTAPMIRQRIHEMQISEALKQNPKEG